MLNFIHDARTTPGHDVPIDISIVDSKRLQMFYASVNEGSFSGAAQILSVSTSAISHAMKGLEEDFGCSLFRRFGPQVRPTTAAIRLMPLVKDLLMRMALMKAELATFSGHSKKLTIRLTLPLVGLLKSGVLSIFCECFPTASLEILLTENPGSELIAKQPDFEISYLQNPGSEIISRHLTDEHFHAYVAPFHVLGQKGRVSMRDLRGSILIFPDQFILEAMNTQLTNGVCDALKKWILPDSGVANELARQGQGIAFLPERAVSSALKEGTLVRLDLSGYKFHRSIYACWDAQRPLTWEAEVFLSLLEDKLDLQGERLLQTKTSSSVQ